RALAPGLPEAERVGEDRGGRPRLVQHQGDAMEAADRVLGWHAAVAPRGLGPGAGDADQREAHAVRGGEGEHRLTAAPLRRLVRHALLDQSLGPPADRLGWNAERSLLGL